LKRWYSFQGGVTLEKFKRLRQESASSGTSLPAASSAEVSSKPPT
jgi:hypothetical protein